MGRGSSWWRTTGKYIEWADLQGVDFETITKTEIRRSLANKTEREWRMEMSQMSSLYIYREFKGEMGSGSFVGGKEAVTWFRARVNCLGFGDQRWERRGDRCKLCGQEGEDLVHFLLTCERLDEMRRQSVQLQRPRMERPVDQVGEFLFGRQMEEQKRRLLHKMWMMRGGILGTQTGNCRVT